MNSIDTTPRDLKEVINGITQEIQNENIEEARDLLFSLVPDELDADDSGEYLFLAGYVSGLDVPLNNELFLAYNRDYDIEIDHNCNVVPPVLVEMVKGFINGVIQKVIDMQGYFDDEFWDENGEFINIPEMSRLLAEANKKAANLIFVK
jgi:hypothetical protein